MTDGNGSAAAAATDTQDVAMRINAAQKELQDVDARYNTVQKQLRKLRAKLEQIPKDSIQQARWKVVLEQKIAKQEESLTALQEEHSTLEKELVKKFSKSDFDEHHLKVCYVSLLTNHALSDLKIVGFHNTKIQRIKLSK